MCENWGIYYYNSKVDSSDKLDLKLYADGFESKEQAEKYLLSHYNFMSKTGTYLKYLVLPYYC